MKKYDAVLNCTLLCWKEGDRFQFYLFVFAQAEPKTGNKQKQTALV